MMPGPLPVDDLLPSVISSLATTPNLVLLAAPGAGKTTRLPASLLKAVAGEVIVLEPRRIAARMAARRVAEEMGESVGQTVGYQVRFEDVGGPRTRLRFLTEGVLTRRMLRDPELLGVDAIVLDEFHERHVETDLALALLKRLQVRRPELRLVVMSATLDPGPVSRFLGECPVFLSQGRNFPLAIRYTAYSASPLEEQVATALRTLLAEGHSGNVLVFLPGVAEIHRAFRACEPEARRFGARLLPLHGGLSPTEQDAAVAPSGQQKVILATNIAESSVTIEGVTAVIDSGLARVAAHSPWSGLPTLEIRRISQAAAAQRAGRAGRTAPGTAIRLYSQEDFAQRAEEENPEILRSDLAALGLALRGMGMEPIASLGWLDTPPEAAVVQAEALLDRLGARLETRPDTHPATRLEPNPGAHSGAAAREMARLPLPPRLARMLLEAQRRGASNEGSAAAALLSSGTPCERTDLLSALDHRLEGAALRQYEQLRRILASVAAPRVSPGEPPSGSPDEALLISVLAGFPDRVARLRAGRQVLLSTGISAELADEPPPYEFMVVLDAEDRSDRALPRVRMTSRIEPEWLLDLFPARMREDTEITWNRGGERVEAVTFLRYDQLVVAEWRNAAPDPAAAADLLAEKALEAGLERFVDPEALAQLLARLQFAGLPAPDLPGGVRAACEGLRSFAELRQSMSSFLALLEDRAGPRLREWAPALVRLRGGRQARVRYESGKPPWVASRMQDFFGMKETPRIGPDRTPVAVHLLAPNQRPVQTTSDLPGFWQRLYPQVRRELMRRYPRHAWPERPEAE